jgi:hypothetical protein
MGIGAVELVPVHNEQTFAPRRRMRALTGDLDAGEAHASQGPKVIVVVAGHIDNTGSKLRLPQQLLQPSVWLLGQKNLRRRLRTSMTSPTR